MRPGRATVVSLSLLVLTGSSRRSEAQFEPPRVFGGAPAASWIAPPDTPGDAYGVFHFRRTFELPSRPERFTVHVSGDNRYRLFVNGRQVSSGPERSDLMHWRYETLDLAPHLRAGKNVLAALVWNWGAHRPVAQFSRRTAFLMQADTEREAVANTGREWKVLREPGLRAHPGGRPRRRRLLRGSARRVGGRQPLSRGAGSRPDFADDGWPSPAVTEGWGAERTQPRGTAITGEAMLWQLVPRSLPPMEEKVVRIATVRRAEGIVPGDAFLRGDGRSARAGPDAGDDPARQRPPHERLRRARDERRCGRHRGPDLRRSPEGREGREGEPQRDRGQDRRSGSRTSSAPAGASAAASRPSGSAPTVTCRWRSRPADDPLRIHDLHGIFTAYPFEEKARFASDLPWIKDMWEVNWRVARLCAWETYFDTPYYEQLQYVGDTRIQALISLYMTGDDRLVRQAISHFDVSRIPEGITASRYPSDLGQYIPTFSLIWVAMVHDYWMHRDDPAYVRGLLPGVRGVLGWYERHLDETGLLGPMPWWSFVDWAKEWPMGIPPGVKDGHSATITLQFAYALQRAAELEDAFGLPARGSALPHPRPEADRGGAGEGVGSGPWPLPRFARGQDGEPADQHDGGAGGRGARPRAARPHGARARRQDARPGHLLLRLLRARGAPQGGPGRSLHRAARALAADAGPGPHHHRGEPGAHPVRLPRLERPPQLRPARHRPRACGPRSRASGRCSSPPASAP